LTRGFFGYIKREMKRVRNALRYILLIVGILITLFAILSGAKIYGGGIEGITKNSPNALPWIILIVLILISWKWELIGGIGLIIFGGCMMYFFNFSLIPALIGLLIITSGVIIVLTKEKK